MMTAEPVLVFEEIAQFLASLSPRKVLAFKTSKKSQARVSYLLDKNKGHGLNAEESREMEQYMLIEHIVQLAKAKALLRVVKK
jgi:SpoU rRNA methylase family enzyme